MPRTKNEDKRQLILAQAKKLFASEGFEGTSMGLLARKIGIPVGSLYTYFNSKDNLLETIIEEGWEDFSEGLEHGLTGLLKNASLQNFPIENASLLELSYLITKALPQLFGDLDLIAILLARSGKGSKLEEKLEALASLIHTLISRYWIDADRPFGFDYKVFKAGIAVMILGSLETLRISHHAELDMGKDDIIAFLVSMVETTLGCTLPDIEIFLV